MRFGKHLVLCVAILALLGGVGCKKKKPNLPPAAQPPTVTQPESEKPAVEPTKEEPILVVPPAPEPEPQPAAPTPKPKPHRRKKAASPPNSPAATPETKPSAAKPVPGSKTGTETPKPPDNVQISAEIPQNVAIQRKQQTEDLLNVAEANLKKVNRTLNDGEQSMQRQVRNFITQSRLAIQDGDFERAYNLATKAQQLSQELVK